MVSWWRRVKARVAGWFSRAPVPGRFEHGRRFAWRGFVATAPLVWPARDYLVYVPRGRPRWRRVPLLVLCHGCKQTAESFAQSTRIAELADREGFVVLLPQQKDTANPWRCWNWFERRTAEGHGEAAIVAAQIRAVRRAYRIDRRRVVAAGLSAGGALAAILGMRHPDLVRAVAVHSGLACGAATSPVTALRVMAQGPDADVVAIGAAARRTHAARDLRIPLLAIHGADDDVVRPRNAAALVRQYLAVNGVTVAPAGAGDDLPPADHEETLALPDGRRQIVREWRCDGRLAVRYVEVQGLGHAWVGGDPAHRFTTAGPPDAAALAAGLFADAAS